MPYTLQSGDFVFNQGQTGSEQLDPLFLAQRLARPEIDQFLDFP